MIEAPRDRRLPAVRPPSRWWLCAALSALWALSTAPAAAAELRYQAPADCRSKADIVEQVERLVGRKLDAIKDITFDAEVTRSAHHWKLRLESHAGGTTATRELQGASCYEVADAGAVAIAMAIQAEAERAAEGELAPEPQEVTPQPTSEASSPARPAAKPASAEQAKSLPGERRAAPVELSVVLGATVDSGALPALSPGGELEVQLGAGWYRLIGLAALYAPQSFELSDGRGGAFSLMLAGALGCLQRPVTSLRLFACLGPELGRLSGEGEGVAQPRLGSYLWSAVRSELGVWLPLQQGLAIQGRVGGAAPLSRRQFVLDGNDPVHRPASLSFRALFGVGLSL